MRPSGLLCPVQRIATWNRSSDGDGWLAMTATNNVTRIAVLYARRATGLRLLTRPGCAVSGRCRCASRSGVISAAGFGALKR